jgi:hypothetical protein
LSDVAEYAYAAAVAAGSRLILGITVLGYKDQLVEIEAVAAVLDP